MTQPTPHRWITPLRLLIACAVLGLPASAQAHDPAPPATEEAPRDAKPEEGDDAEEGGDPFYTLSGAVLKTADGRLELSLEDKTSAVEPSSFEVSLSSAHIFPSTDIFQYNDEVELVPTNAALLLIEYFLTYRWRLRFMYNLRTSTEKRIDRETNEVNEQVAPSTVSAGLSWVPVSVRFRETSRVEFQGSLLLSTVLDDEHLIFPTWTGRVHLMQDAEAGVGVYLGMFYEFRRNKVGPFYGVGYRF